MKVEHVDGKEYWTVESLADLQDWDIMYEEPWKLGVVRLHCRNAMNPREFRMLYCSDKILGVRFFPRPPVRPNVTRRRAIQ